MNPYYEQDGITIYHGQCLDVLSGGAWFGVDLTLTDPPYNVGLAYCDGDNRSDYAEWTREWFEKVPRPLVVTPGTVNLAMWQAMERPRWTCIWVKPNQCSPSALRGFNVWEPVLVYGQPCKPVGHDAWVHPIGTNQSAAGDHPCPKWLPFWRQLLAKFSEPGQLVLDPFSGSGTTLEAAYLTGRRAIGIEIEERYCEIAAKRLEQARAQQTLPLEASA